MAKKLKAPASNPALAPTMPVGEGVDGVKTGELITAEADKSALAPACRRGDEVLFVRKDGIEMACIDGKWLMRDIDLGKLIGLSRPRHIRDRIKSMVNPGSGKQSEIKDGQLLTVIDDDITIYYVDSSLANTLAFRSNIGNAEAIAMRMMRVTELFARTSRDNSAAEEKALAAYERAVAMWDKAKTAEAKAALVPAITRRASAAGFEPPCLAFKSVDTKDQPRLPGL